MSLTNHLPHHGLSDTTFHEISERSQCQSAGRGRRFNVRCQVQRPSQAVRFLALVLTLSGAGTVHANEDFFSKWSTGVALIRTPKDVVNEATVVNGTVRVENQSRYEASILVARKFHPLQRAQESCNGADITSSDWWRRCAGVMIGVGLGSSNSSSSSGAQALNLIAVGLTIGSSVGEASSHWNVGFGIGRKLGVRVLGDGLRANQALPDGESQVRYKSKDVTAPFAFFTVHW